LIFNFFSSKFNVGALNLEDRELIINVSDKPQRWLA